MNPSVVFCALLLIAATAIARNATPHVPRLDVESYLAAVAVATARGDPMPICGELGNDALTPATR